jgi:putative RecB family exonuclease
VSSKVPSPLSPSSISAFRTCPLSWRLDHLERLERLPSLAANLGTFIHAVAEALCRLPGDRRTLEAARSAATAAWSSHVADEEWVQLDVPEREVPEVKRQVWRAVKRWFTLEDPCTVVVAGTERWVHGDVGGVAMRGIVDRLDVDERTGGFVVTDYKSGRMPRQPYQDERLFGVWVYAHLVAQTDLGRPVTSVRHLYLGDRPGEVVRPVTEEALAATAAVVVETHREMTACCETGTFETRPGPLCGWCSFKPSCPAFGGDLDQLLATGRRRPARTSTPDDDQLTLDVVPTLVSVS